MAWSCRAPSSSPAPASATTGDVGRRADIKAGKAGTRGDTASLDAASGTSGRDSQDESRPEAAAITSPCFAFASPLLPAGRAARAALGRRWCGGCSWRAGGSAARLGRAAGRCRAGRSASSRGWPRGRRRGGGLSPAAACVRGFARAASAGSSPSARVRAVLTSARLELSWAVRVLVACERSGRVRDQFALRGHDVWSCDTQPSLTPGQHILGDVLAHIDGSWDMLLAFPPCTFLTRAGSRYWSDPTWRAAQLAAGAFALALWSAPVPRIMIENPPGRLPEFLGKFHQTIQPFHFGHEYTKLTCLWLQGLPPLMSTVLHRGRISWTEKNNSRSNQRSNRRSLTFPGIAQAMADQWG